MPKLVGGSALNPRDAHLGYPEPFRGRTLRQPFLEYEGKHLPLFRFERCHGIAQIHPALDGFVIVAIRADQLPSVAALSSCDNGVSSDT